MNTANNTVSKTTTKLVLQSVVMGIAAIAGLLFLGQSVFGILLMLYVLVSLKPANTPSLDKIATAMVSITVLFSMIGLELSHTALPYTDIVDVLALAAALTTFVMKRV